MKKLLHIIYQPYKWLIYFPLMGIFTITLSFSAIILSYITGTYITRYNGIIWARLSALITPMFVSVKGKSNLVKGQSYIIVSNHQSQYDIFVIYGWIPRHFKWVMKHTLRKVPGLGLYCSRMEHIFIDRSDTKKALESIKGAADRITNGTCVVFFPEGTIFGKGELGPFKKGAFKMAIDLQLPVLPVTINGTENVLPYKSLDLFPGKAEMIIHEPIPIENYTDDSIDELIEESRKRISSSLSYKG